MILLTTTQLPEGKVIKTAYSLIYAQRAIKISTKGIFEAIATRGKNEYDEALSHFSSLAPNEANAIVGVQISTSTQQFSDGTFLYLSIVGTPVYCEDIE